MAGLIIETPLSREGSKGYTGGPLTREYTVLHEPTLNDAIALVEVTAEISYLGRERKNIAWRSLGYDNWLFTVTYGSAGNNEGGLSPDQFNFRITASTAHITQSYETFGRFGVGANQHDGTDLTVDAVNPLVVVPDALFPSGTDLGKTLVITSGAGWTVGLYTITDVDIGASWTLNRSPAAVGTGGAEWYVPADAPDTKGAIGQDKDSIHGCDTVVPSGEFALQANRTSLTHADYRSLKQLVGKVTDRDWKGYAAGTIMYLGAEPAGSDGTLPTGQAVNWWCLGHQFRWEEHQINVRIGDILLPYVPAFAYVDVTYAPAVPAGANSLVPKPIAAYVHRVHRGFFNPELLGIP